MKTWYVGLKLMCAIAFCGKVIDAKGVDKKDAERDAREKGWSVSGDKCRCPQHKGMRHYV